MVAEGFECVESAVPLFATKLNTCPFYFIFRHHLEAASVGSVERAAETFPHSYLVVVLVSLLVLSSASRLS